MRFYQLWNEPNIYPEWGEQPVNAGDFTRLLKLGYTRAKQADPQVVIISAGLAQTTEDGPDNLNDVTFLEQMYDAGAGPYFDILAVQDYGLWTGPGDRRVEFTRTNFSRPILLRRVMVEDRSLPYPESVAASEIHKAGQRGAEAAVQLFQAMGVGALIRLLGRSDSATFDGLGIFYAINRFQVGVGKLKEGFVRLAGDRTVPAGGVSTFTAPAARE